MADDITKDELWRVKFQAFKEDSLNELNAAFKRFDARMNDLTSGSGDAEAAVIENTNQRKRPRFEELKKLETKVSKLRVENQRMKMENEEMKSKLQLKENENKELRRFLKEMGQNQKLMQQSICHYEDWIFSQTVGQVCQASDAGPPLVPGYSSDAIPDLSGFSDFDF